MTLVPVAPGALPAHDHRALHGGQLSMSGDHHVEYVGADGEYRFWVTNATREPVTSGIAASVKDGDTSIPLTLDSATGLLSAHGDGAGTRPVLIEVTGDGATFSLGFNAMPADGMAGMHDHEHDHDPR